MTAPDPIQTYNLFGESADLPDVVHCETIQTRSRLHDWEFAPHRHARLHQVLFVESGGGRASLDGAALALVPGVVLNIPVGIVHGFRFDPGTQGLVVTLAAEILDEALQPGEGLRPVLNRAALLRAPADAVETMRGIAAEFPGRGFARAQVLRSLAGLLLGQIARALAATRPDGDAPGAPDLLTRFEALVEAHYTEHWPVADYAAALAVSPTHLSRVARTATGRPASALIEERLIREARRNLVYTNLPVSTVAYALGFADPAYFSRVFSRATGLSPRAFRRRSQSS
ncbi:helix-turn-helix domain-containing protein [Psychromarinibacter sp. C21-152]|uniref:Helix-turn-helix domain-containing protein n=1 Tax=Psychromarinibacter sediminicola TaxID=3033385 RepID=A0AAE3NT66_9RHOB|nr:helix-turn-helix domain-containing protein [Psychromarinibacter sediminicola]MDF0603088.1 helix-turn-helix domain-containing protein [Psychromarinibacter sediminicola]